MTTSHFLAPLLNEFAARLNEAVANAQAEILATLQGVAQVQVAAPKTSAGKGQKRSPEALAKLVEDVFGFIQRHPGDRIEQLAQRSGLSTKEMNLPIKRLRESKRIVSSGAKRATAYRVRGAKQ